MAINGGQSAVSHLDKSGLVVKQGHFPNQDQGCVLHQGSAEERAPNRAVLPVADRFMRFWAWLAFDYSQ